MTKNKLQHFKELKSFDMVFQPRFDEVFNTNYKLKGKWAQDFFHNNNPIVLELGCGKCEYTIGLAEYDRSKNYIGIDIKGARMWNGAKYAKETALSNVAFIRTRVELINSFFGVNEISEIWITFPDPQNNKQRRRLSSSRFLNLFKQFMKPNGYVHLKTDSLLLHDYTKSLLKQNKLTIVKETNDLYHSNLLNDQLKIQTYYEKKFLERNFSISYLKFMINTENEIFEIDDFDNTAYRKKREELEALNPK